MNKTVEYETEEVLMTKVKIGNHIFNGGYLFIVKEVRPDVSDGVLVIRFTCDGVKGDREPPMGYRENVILGGRYDHRIPVVVKRDF